MNIYRLSESRVLRFSQEAAATFDRYRRQNRTEAGGVLLGRVYDSEIVIEIATPPTAADRRGRFFFNRSQRNAQRRVDKAWNISAGEQIYLGEWHSHPEDIAAPSERDREMISTNLREAKMQIDFLILVVLGHRRDWVGVRQPKELMELTFL